MVVLFSLLAFLVFAVTVLYLLIGRERYGSDGSAETLQIGASAGALAKNVLKPEPCRTIRVYFIKPSRYLKRFVPAILDLIKLHIGVLPVVQL